jgi:hypothetical protein
MISDNKDVEKNNESVNSDDADRSLVNSNDTTIES